MCHLTATSLTLQQAISQRGAAKALAAGQRAKLGVQALAGHRSVSGLAQEHAVSRKFVYRQAATARAALQAAFPAADVDDNAVLFQLPVTKAWLRQATLGLTLICHSSYRGVVEFFRDVLDVPCSVGTVHNVLRAAAATARRHNLAVSLDKVAIAGLDEIFQSRQPVLVGADIASSYCFLLSGEERRDADTWGVRLLELQERGFAPQATIADFGSGIRAGQRLALPDVPCRGDLFHALNEIMPVVQFLENRAYHAVATHDQLVHKKTKLHQRSRRDQVRQLQVLSQKAAAAARENAKAVALADDLALLAQWLRQDVFAVCGLAYADRCQLFDFIVAELQARIPLCPHRLAPLCTLLHNHRDQLLAFAAQLDDDLIELAADFEVPVLWVRQLLDQFALPEDQPRRWQKEAALRQQLRHRFHPLAAAVRALQQRVVRASSVIENLNSRLRNYFFLRRQLRSGSLALLQFFLNHRRFLRSTHRQRVGKSPAELLTGQAHAHWLELLGYTRFSRN